MRSRWEEKYTEPTDEPVTLTESQLRALKRGATIGMIAAILAIIAVGIAGYSLVSARSINSDAAIASKSSADQPAPEAAAPAAAAPTTAPAVQPAAPAAQPAAQPAAAPVEAKPALETQTPKAARVSAHKVTARTHRISRSIEEKPVTIPAATPEPTPAAANAKAPALSPIAPLPLGADAPAKPKPAAHDSSAGH